ncbi:rCG61383 [Rattus norvegicus]|uniref:RCG61383 n=1 Tax=Rattus norvegicus TaxID=10116 RepID=A6HBZ7_RAT|nr:rCG61383 [Rattus norvegicus]
MLARHAGGHSGMVHAHSPTLRLIGVEDHWFYHSWLYSAGGQPGLQTLKRNQQKSYFSSPSLKCLETFILCLECFSKPPQTT